MKNSHRNAHPGKPRSIAGLLSAFRNLLVERLPEILVLTLGILLSLAGAWNLHHTEQLERKAAIRHDLHVYAQAIQRELLGLVADIQAIAQFYGASEQVSADEFARFARPSLERNRTIYALQWAPRVLAAERDAFEARAREELQIDFAIRDPVDGALVPAARRPEYFPLYRAEPLAPNAAVLGFDSLSEPLRRAALEAARDSGRAVATVPLTLVEETEGQHSLVIYVPAQNSAAPDAGPEARRRDTLGFALGVVRLGDLMDLVLARFPPTGLSLMLRDKALPGAAGLLGLHVSRRPGQEAPPDPDAFMRPWVTAAPLRVAERTLELRALPATGAYPASLWPPALLGLGLVISIALTALLQTHRKTLAQQRESEALKAAESMTRRALAQAERLAQARSDFLANMSHEIRTPLNAVLGLAQVGQRENIGRKVQDHFTRILDAGRHLLGVVDDILDFSKIEAGKLTLDLETMTLGRIIDDALSLVAANAYAKGLEVHALEAPDLPLGCEGDARRLTQVLVNLLANAVKFTKAGGIGLRVAREDDWLSFRVEDSGIGMTAEQLARLFEPFQQADSSTTRRFGGTGLGLAISKRLVDMMGGTLELDSEPGVGSRFRVRIPLIGATAPAHPVTGRLALAGLPEAESTALAEALAGHGVEAIQIPADAEWPAADWVLAVPQAVTRARLNAVHAHGQGVAILTTPGPGGSKDPVAEALPEIERPARARHLLALLDEGGRVAAHPPPHEPRLPGLRILAAEDNEINRLVLEEMLTSEGAQLQCAENGRQLLEHLQREGDAAYSILLTDIQMPEMNGYEVARRCREAYPGLPVVGLTAHAMAEERGRCLAAGMVEHLPKPVDMDRLVAVIQTHGRHGADAPTVADAEGLDTTHPSRDGGKPRTSAPPDTEVSAIDWAGLEARYASKPEFVERLIGLARNHYREHPERLRTAASAGDLEGVAALAHEIKGMSGNLMAWPLQEQAKRTERAARHDQPEAMDEGERLAAVMEDWLRSLNER